jgi:hypothetical protein
MVLPARLAVAQSESTEEKDPHRQRLGLRAGYVTTPSGLNNVFGSGLDLSIHWIQRIKYPFGFDMTLGAFYLGSTSREDITISVFNQQFDNVSMRVLHVTAAPMLEFGLGSRTELFVSAGAGLYTVSLLLDQAFSEFDLTNSHFGVVASSGIIRQISGNWFVDVSFQLHKFWTSAKTDDLFFLYSEGDSNPIFYDATVGVMLRLF